MVMIMSTNKAQLKEALSAFMDGEATDIEVRRLLKEMPFDHTLRDSWRYHQLSSAIINKELSTEIIDFSAGISSAIKLEKNHRALSLSNYLIKPLGRFAIAASVATVALVGMQQYKHTVEHPSSFASANKIQLNLASSNMRTSAEFGIPPISARNVSISNFPQKKSKPLNKVLLKNESSSENLTREQVQRYLNGLLARYNETEDKLITQ
tara:strand:+ start:82 stop:708 length:627 start_codon:yes stop_codon:yes gene_type:complete